MIQAAHGSEAAPHYLWKAFREDDSSKGSAVGLRGYSQVVLNVTPGWREGEKEGGNAEWREGVFWQMMEKDTFSRR